MQIQNIPIQESKPERVSIEGKLPTPQKEIKLEKVELSDNIQAFDKRKRVYTTNPNDYNSISLKKPENSAKSISDVVVDPLYNSAAKALGVNNVHDWEKDYDKVQFIVDWAKEKTKIDDNQRLVSWIYDQASKSPSITNRRIDDLYTYIKMGGKSFTPITKTRIVEKIVRVKSKPNTEEIVSSWMKGVLSGSA